MAVSEAVNATVNASSNLSSNVSSNATSLFNDTLSKAAAAAGTASSFIPLIFVRLWDLVAAPFRHGEMLWIIFPLFFSLLVMEFYWDRHGDDEIGWAAALANSLVLIFVAVDLVKRSFENATPWAVLKEILLASFGNGTLPISPQVLLLIMFLGSAGIVITIVNYYHLLPKKMAYIISHHAPINFLAYFAIAIVYSDNTGTPIPFDLATLVAAALLFILILIVVFSVKKTIQRLLGGDDRQRGWFR